jgi:hypothetical protein
MTHLSTITQVIAKRRAKILSANLILDHKKSGIALNYVREGGMPHTGIFLTRAKTLF